jgi:hypothetical protein
MERLAWPTYQSSAHDDESIDIVVFCDGTGKNGRVDTGE